MSGISRGKEKKTKNSWFYKKRFFNKSSITIGGGGGYESAIAPDIPDKIKLNSWIFQKPKTPRNSTMFFLGYLWKFHFVFIFDTPGNTISSNPTPHPARLDFFRNSPQGKVTEAGKFGAGNFS